MIQMTNPWEEVHVQEDVRVFVKPIEPPVWTEPVEEIEEEARIRSQVARGRRLIQDEWKRKNTNWLYATSIPFIVGLFLLVQELFRYTPTPALICLGILLVIPFGVKAMERIEH